MIAAIPLAWLQLSREKFRFATAVAGVVFAVILILVQLGFQDALFKSAVAYHGAFDYDLAMINPKTQFIVLPEYFSQRRLYQILGDPAVESVSGIHIGQRVWKNPENPKMNRAIFVVGFDPSDRAFARPDIMSQTEKLKLADVVLYDVESRPEFGPIEAMFNERGKVEVELANRRVEVRGLFKLGTSFGIDAAIMTSDLNFQRLFPERDPNLIEVGLVHLVPGTDPDAARDALAARLPSDVELLTRAQFIAREVAYWNSATPIGYVFGFGVIIGLVVGSIIVYQILFADVSDHLQEYATLKALGYTDLFLFGVVIQEAMILAISGFIPGVGAAMVLYHYAGAATRLPLQMTPERVVMVFCITLGMCILSASIALRKVQSADPADVF
jgi:putative ABC transport system permease protein